MKQIKTQKNFGLTKSKVLLEKTKSNFFWCDHEQESNAFE